MGSKNTFSKKKTRESLFEYLSLQAMDNRMLLPWQKGPADWFIRLPLVLASFVFPTPWLLLLAHVANMGLSIWFRCWKFRWSYDRQTFSSFGPSVRPSIRPVDAPTLRS